MFARQGFHSTTMEDIARAAGVTRTILYKHYSSKDEIAAASLAASKTTIRASIESARRSSNPRDQLTVFVNETIEFIARGGRLYGALLADQALAGKRAEHEAEMIRGEIDDFIRSIAVECGFVGDNLRADVYVRAIVGAFERCAQILAGERSSTPDPELLAKHLVTFAWSGLGAGATSEP